VLRKVARTEMSRNKNIIYNLYYLMPPLPSTNIICSLLKRANIDLYNVGLPLQLLSPFIKAI